jgi:hypothetical protein
MCELPTHFLAFTTIPPRKCPLPSAYLLPTILGPTYLVLSRLFLPNFLPVGKKRTHGSRNFLPVGNGLSRLAVQVTKCHDDLHPVARVSSPASLRRGEPRVGTRATRRTFMTSLKTWAAGADSALVGVCVFPQSGEITPADIELHVCASRRII